MSQNVFILFSHCIASLTGYRIMGSKYIFSLGILKTFILCILNLMWLMERWVVPCIFTWKTLWLFPFYLWCSKISRRCVSCVAIFIHPVRYSIDSPHFFCLRKCLIISLKELYHLYFLFSFSENPLSQLVDFYNSCINLL